VKPRVIALGQPAAGDDAVGMAVLDRLQGDPAAAGWELVFAPTAHNLVERLLEPGLVVIVDAVLAEQPAGTVITGRPEAFEPSSTAAWSSHGFGAIQAIELARALQPSGLPAEVFVVGVVIDRPAEYRDGLSEAVARAVDQAASAILRLAGGH